MIVSGEPLTAPNGLVFAASAALACSAEASENAPLTRRPGLVEPGSATESAASPAVLITLALMLAAYSFATPGVNAPKAAGVPSVSASVAGTVPPTSPRIGVDVGPLAVALARSPALHA